MDRPGLSKSRLEKMRQVLTGFVDRQEIPSLVTLVSHNDDVQVETLGQMVLGEPVPVQRDSIFRIASLSKLVTAVVAMQLVEECKMRLDD